MRHALRRCVGIVAGTVLAVGVVPVAGVVGQALDPAPRAVADDGTGSPAGALTEQDALARAKSTGQNVEITSQRSESGEVYATPDGQLQAVEHLRPVRARVDGVWKNVDDTLVHRSDGSVGPAVSTVGMSFSGGGTGAMVLLEQAGRKLGFSWPSALPAPTLEGDTATYASVLPGVDLRLRADTDGYHEVLVVHDAQAAQNPALAQLTLGVSAPGMTLQESDSGGLQAMDSSAGGVVFEAAKPLMWDSAGTTTAAPALRARVRAAATAADTATEPPQDPAEAPTDGSTVAPVDVDLSADGSHVSLTPDQSMLTDSATTYPVYIDPQTYTPKASDWTMVSHYWASTPQYKFNGDSDAGVGDCSWSYCAPNDIKRVFYKLPTSTFAGKTVISATFVAHETWSASCDARDVELWKTKAFGSGTTWNSSTDNWLTKLDTQDVAHGGSGSCPAGDVEFDAKSAVADAASSGASSAYFGLRASDEGDPYGWKRFSDDAYLRVTYNRPPPEIAMSQLSMSPGGSCRTPANKVSVRDLPSMTAVDVKDPDGDQVSAQFQAYWDAGDGKGFVAHWTSAKTTPKKSGSDFTMTLPTSIPKNKEVAWYARAADYLNGTYYSYSPWSGVGSATGCYFVWDTSVPAGPSVASTEYPQSDPGDPDDPWYDGVGEYGTFTFATSDTSVVKYEYGVNADPSSANTLTTTGGASQHIGYRPTEPGVDYISVESLDAAGNKSQPTTYYFRVKAGQPAIANWAMDDVAGATQAAGTTPDRTMAVNGAPTLAVPGKVGNAVHFDGAHDYLQSDLPVVHTSLSFSVAAWVKLDTLPSGAAIIAAQPGNNSPGFELYYSQVYDRWAFNQYTADTAAATPVRAMGPTAGLVTAGQWVHLVGTYSLGDSLLSLYVNGTLVGTTPYSTPWDSRRGLIIGGSSYDGTPSAFFPGTIDDVRLYDKALSAGEVTNLYNGASIGTGRPARAVFPLDGPAGAANGDPVTQVTGNADVAPAVFHGGVTPGADGAQDKAATFNGTDGYATAGTPYLNNLTSFSVGGWVKLSGTPSQTAVVASQAGVNRPGFELYYSTTGGWSFDQYTSDDAGGTVVRAAQGSTTHAPANTWTYLIGSYDSISDQMRLFVNGTLAGTTTFSAPFYASGPFQIGASRNQGANISFFPGQIDDVQLYDRPLSADEAADLYHANPLVEGRWRLDTATGSPAVSPDEVSSGGHPLTLGAGASIDPSNYYIGTGSGLLLNGTSTGYAQTAASPVDTGTSFSAAAWVQTPSRPQSTVTVMSVPGTKADGFSVRYVPDATDPADAGYWTLVMNGSDATPASASTSSVYADPTQWTHLGVTYDAVRQEMRLYVDGILTESPCADSDGDGTPDSPTCVDRVPWAFNTLSFTATGGLQLGRDRTSTGAWGDYLAGDLDDVWAFQGTASDDQMAALNSGQDFQTTPGP